MAKFVSISGASTTGKTALMNSLSTYRELGKVVFSPDMHDVVWSSLVKARLFTDFTEISTDSEYLCTYIIRLIDHYNNYLDSLRDSDALVILEGCWVDLSIYAMLNMWYSRIVKSVQEEILYKASKYSDEVSRIYITKADDANYPVAKFRVRGKMSTFRDNRPLEIRYYDLATHLKDAVAIPSSDVTEASMFVIDDLMKLGYL